MMLIFILYLWFSFFLSFSLSFPFFRTILSFFSLFPSLNFFSQSPSISHTHFSLYPSPLHFSPIPSLPPFSLSLTLLPSLSLFCRCCGPWHLRRLHHSRDCGRKGRSESSRSWRGETMVVNVYRGNMKQIDATTFIQYLR